MKRVSKRQRFIRSFGCRVNHRSEPVPENNVIRIVQQEQSFPSLLESLFSYFPNRMLLRGFLLSPDNHGPAKSNDRSGILRRLAALI
jgi:hypothetical protein